LAIADQYFHPQYRSTDFYWRRDTAFVLTYKGVIMNESTLKTTRTDMKSIIQDAQELFREATSVTGEKAEELRTRGLHLLDSALVKAQEVQTVALETGKELAVKTDDYVHENPWRAVAIAAGVGALLGFLISRK
jgi:ElaB/YqjD/DUF883 family membrane-anchored ribosome-binding protein